MRNSYTECSAADCPGSENSKEIQMKKFMTVVVAAIMAITLSAPAWAQGKPAAESKPASVSKQEKKKAKAKAKSEKKAKKAAKAKK